MDDLPNEEVSNRWRDRRGVAYAVDRQVIRIEDLLVDACSTSVRLPVQFDDGFE